MRRLPSAGPTYLDLRSFRRGRRANFHACPPGGAGSDRACARAPSGGPTFVTAKVGTVSPGARQGVQGTLEERAPRMVRVNATAPDRSAEALPCASEASGPVRFICCTRPEASGHPALSPSRAGLAAASEDGAIQEPAFLAGQGINNAAQRRSLFRAGARLRDCAVRARRGTERAAGAREGCLRHTDVPSYRPARRARVPQGSRNAGSIAAEPSGAALWVTFGATKVTRAAGGRGTRAGRRAPKKAPGYATPSRRRTTRGWGSGAPAPVYPAAPRRMASGPSVSRLRRPAPDLTIIAPA